MEAAKKRNIAYIENVKNAPAFGLRDKIGYLCGDLGFNSLQVIVNSYLMLFCVNILGMNAVHFAGIVFICKALDALNDTFIGRTVDRRAPAKNGKMKPYLLWFAVPYAIFTLITIYECSRYAVCSKNSMGIDHLFFLGYYRYLYQCSLWSNVQYYYYESD